MFKRSSKQQQTPVTKCSPTLTQ